MRPASRGSSNAAAYTAPRSTCTADPPSARGENSVPADRSDCVTSSAYDRKVCCNSLAMGVGARGVGVVESDPLEIPHPLPVGDGGVEGTDLVAGGVDVEIDDAVAERLPRQLAAVQQVRRLAQRTGQSGQLGINVGVAPVDVAAVEPL